MHDQRQQRQRRRFSVPGVALLLLLAVAGCGGRSSNCALAPGPCAGDFAAEDLLTAVVEPSQLTVSVGANATFVVLAPKLTNPTYQWYRSAPDGTIAQIPDAVGASYTLVGVQRTDNNTTFMANVDGAYGSARVVSISSGGKLTVE